MKTQGFLLKYPDGKSEINIEGDLPTKDLIITTWLELKNKRDDGKLIPGALYRITDYNCTTTQENTQSAGHQFDIVLLALSEDKLAEEGWAMMHDNIYDVTFNDNVTKKCYYYPNNGNETLVDCITLLGLFNCQAVVVNQDNKTITTETDSDELAETGVLYNYFQNSNLAAWKVWYCLDNDKTRFAWAERDVPTFICNIENALSTLSNAQITRDYDSDSDGKYGYLLVDFESDAVMHVLTDRELKDTGDYTTYFSKNVYTVTHVEVLSSSVTANGRGVIYRLIDEFNNDIKYDFKNIQFKRKITDGQYDATNGTDTWCYTLNIWYNDICQDASIVGNTIPNDEGYVSGVYDNKFGYATAYDLSIEGVNTFAFALGNNVVLSLTEGGAYYGINSNTIGNLFYSNTIGDLLYSNIIGNGFSSNIIGNGFRGNIIGHDFSSNTIGSGVVSNMIGNDFSSKTISDNTSYKNYGNNGVELATKV